MSGIKSRSRKERATDIDPLETRVSETTLAVIVAHGAPSDPGPLDQVVKQLAKRVEAFTCGYHVVGATLAMPGSLEAELEHATPSQTTVIYPFFMSTGWFVSKELPRRVSTAIANPVDFLQPFGLDLSLPALCIQRASDAAGACDQAPDATVLVLAAHGSQKGPASAQAARAIQESITDTGTFAEVRLGFVEENPTISQAAAGLTNSPAVCLPLFATTAGHVQADIPEQLAAANFQGTLMPPIGEDDEVPRLIAAALAKANQPAG
jgi:sirohydrochlorin ferrochelatase